MNFGTVEIGGREIIEIEDDDEWAKLPKDFQGPVVYYHVADDVLMFWPSSEMDDDADLEIST